MGRTIAQWRAIVDAKKDEEAALAGVDSTSNAADWNLWADVVSFVAYLVEGLFDIFKTEVNATIAAQKPHTLNWYETKAKAFQYGVLLPEFSDVYEVVPPVDPSVLIVTQAAAVELPVLNKLRVKVAKGDVGALEPLTGDERDALEEYMRRVRDAGVRLEVTTGEPDDLKVALNVYYDPLVINAVGERIDGTELTPVKDAINSYLSQLSFNGLFVLNDMIDAVEAVEGVRVCEVLTASANYASTPYVLIPVRYQPDAGYMALNETYFNTNITYIPNL